MKNPAELPNPRTCLIELARSNEFLEAKRKGKTLPMAMAEAALSRTVSIREAHNGHLDISGNALGIISTLPDFLVGQVELDRIREKEKRTRISVPREVKKPHLKKVIPFNHAVRGMIDSNPRLDTRALREFIVKTGMGLYRSDELDFYYLSQEALKVIVGMQHEIATEQALWQIDGVDDIENADLDDELDGFDLRCSFHGQNFEIDAKSSLEDERDAWYRWDPSDPLPFWTGIPSKKLGNHFRANEQQVEQIADRLEGLLKENLRPDHEYAIV